MAKQEIVPQETTLPAAITPMDMMKLAIDRGADLDQLERLMDLQQRWEADQARKAYVVAMAEFKADPLTINKNKEAEFNGKVQYEYASLDTVTDTIVPALAAHGMSHAWKMKQEGTTLTVTCVLTHVMGHSEDVSMSSAPDTSGSKNAIQAIASANSYLQRYTLLAITGLATADKLDDDAASVEVLIDEAQKLAVIKLIEEVNASLPSFLKHFGIDYIDLLPAGKYDSAMSALNEKKKQQAKGSAK